MKTMNDVTTCAYKQKRDDCKSLRRLQTTLVLSPTIWPHLRVINSPMAKPKSIKGWFWRRGSDGKLGLGFMETKTIILKPFPKRFIYVQYFSDGGERGAICITVVSKSLVHISIKQTQLNRAEHSGSPPYATLPWPSMTLTIQFAM